MKNSFITSGPGIKPQFLVYNETCLTMEIQEHGSYKCYIQLFWNMSLLLDSISYIPLNSCGHTETGPRFKVTPERLETSGLQGQRLLLS